MTIRLSCKLITGDIIVITSTKEIAIHNSKWYTSYNNNSTNVVHSESLDTVNMSERVMAI